MCWLFRSGVHNSLTAIMPRDKNRLATPSHAFPSENPEVSQLVGPIIKRPPRSPDFALDIIGFFGVPWLVSVLLRKFDYSILLNLSIDESNQDSLPLYVAGVSLAHRFWITGSKTQLSAAESFQDKSTQTECGKPLALCYGDGQAPIKADDVSHIYTSKSVCILFNLPMNGVSNI